MSRIAAHIHEVAGEGQLGGIAQFVVAGQHLGLQHEQAHTDRVLGGQSIDSVASLGLMQRATAKQQVHIVVGQDGATDPDADPDPDPPPP